MDINYQINFASEDLEHEADDFSIKSRQVSLVSNPIVRTFMDVWFLNRFTRYPLRSALALAPREHLARLTTF